MPFNGFANFDGIKGECSEAGHKDWVDVLSYGHAVTRPPTTATGTGVRTTVPASHAEFTIVKLLDVATPKLNEAACKGTRLSQVVIELWRPLGNTTYKYMEYQLKDVLISGVAANGQAGGPPSSPVETVTLTYASIEWAYRTTLPNGTLGSEVKGKGVVGVA